MATTATMTPTIEGADTKAKPKPKVRRSHRPPAEAEAPERATPPPRPRWAHFQSPPLAPTPQAETAPPAAPPMTQAEGLQELARRAALGNQTCLAALRKILDADPESWRKLGDVTALAERAWVELLAQENHLLQECIRRRQQALKADLAGGDSTPLEKLVIDVLGVSYLAVMQGEYAAAQVGGSLEQARHRQRRAESAVKRFAAITRTLTLVRTLLPKGKPPTPDR